MYAECAALKTRSRSEELTQRSGEWESGGVAGVSLEVELKDEEGVSGGVRSEGARREAVWPSLLVGEEDGEEARSRGRR